jgi:hypothetical protein
LKKLDDIWERKAATEDYRAANEYLTLIFSEAQARSLVRKLRAAPTTKRQAKDLLRASQTQLLEKESPHVENDLKKIKKGKKLSPVLLIRGDGNRGVTLTIADGHHRICASWYWNEDVPVASALSTCRAGASRRCEETGPQPLQWVSAVLAAHLGRFLWGCHTPVRR